MAAPTLTARGTPGGIKMDDGYSTKIAFNRNATIQLWEKTVKPPGIDGGDAIDTTTMHNTTWRTMSSRALKTLTESTFTAAYDPKVYDSITSLINMEGSITVHFPDASTLTFYGYLKTFDVNDHSEGEQPTASCSIVPTNYDPVNRVEAAPVLVEVSGT